MYAKGHVVELKQMEKNDHLNGQRGFVQESKGNRYIVNVDDKIVSVKSSKMTPVFCLGLPVPYWMVSSDRTTLHEAVDDFLAEKKNAFKVFVVEKELETGCVFTAFVVNMKFFKMAFDRCHASVSGIQDYLPLLRIYAVDKTDQETNICFDRCCFNIPNDLSKFHWYMDVTHEELASLTK